MATRARAVAILLIILASGGLVAAGVSALVLSGPLDAGGGSTVPVPTAEMIEQTTAQLAGASAAQGVCYGWRLNDSATTLSQGSNLGPQVPVDADPVRCPRWIEVRAAVTYTSPNSELEDSASVQLVAEGVPVPPVTALDRFGLTTQAFIDDPAWAACRAALALPLLVAESGAASPAPTATAAAPAGAAVPRAGSDFWRARWPHAVGGAALLAGGALLAGIGLVVRAHQQARRRTGTRRTGRPAANQAATGAT